ncbi:MAG: hypothetical protein AB7O62_17995 [Pirellulales bacterium]
MQLLKYSNNPWPFVLGVFLAVCLFLTGCGPDHGPGAKDLSLDKALAKQSLTTVLDAWKAGDKAETLKSRQPAIVAGDWGDAKLLDYKVLGERDGGANLIFQVELVVDRNGRQATREAAYIVGTSPTITVFPMDE